MQAHKVVDSLLGKGPYKLFRVIGIDDVDLEKTAQAIRVADKFKFDSIPMEKAGEKEDGVFAITNLTNEEKQIWSEGLIPLPCDICWYEFPIGIERDGEYYSPNDTICLLSMEIEGELYVSRFDVLLKTQELIYDGIAVCCSKQNQIGIPPISKVELAGNHKLIKHLQTNEQSKLQKMATSIVISIMLTLAINSKSTEIVDGPVPPPKVNAKRKKKGLTPLPAHRIVNIVPRRFQYHTDEHGVERRSPRLHWRRTHVRTLATGKRIVIARMLVGKQELGAVSHEYRIRSSV